LIRIRTILPAIVLMIAACAAPPPPAVVVPEGEARFLTDPRVGWTGTSTPAVDRAFENAWRYILAGDFTKARERLDYIRTKNADYAPATLADAAIAIREKRLEDARAIADRLLERYPNYTAAAVYEAEIDIAENRLESAYDRYRSIVGKEGAPPTAADRVAELQTRIFDRLYGAALTAKDAESVRLLREALKINPSASAARILLVQRLVAQRQYDEARRELDPILSSGEADKVEVQEALAEIDVGKGRYQQAINRYERLTRRDPDGRFARRLAEIKDAFAEANMPTQYRRALESESISRADLAVLLYWKLTAIRFAQDVPAPPIAIDIGEVPGRDELIRAIALGIFSVDPITRRVNPYATVNAASLSRTAARVLALRGSSCRTLAACGIEDPATAGDDGVVSGRTAAALIDQLERVVR
jgi:tetratricopeptide (TPR) repeat protein